MNNKDLKKAQEILKKLQCEDAAINALPAAIYARKSTKDESSVSLLSQIDSCKKYIEGVKELNLISVYEEDNRSGFTTVLRKEFNKLIDEVKRGKIKVIIAYAMDRISRNVSDCTEIESIVNKAGGMIMYASQSFEDTADGECFKNVVRAFDQRLPQVTSEKSILAGYKNAAKKEFNGGTAPYGYKIVARKYRINTKEAPAVKLMFRMFIAGNTYQEISDELTSRGYKTREGKSFHANTISYILHNVRYSGTYLYNDAKARKRKDRVATKELTEFRYDKEIPAIISKKIFNKAQEILENGRMIHSKKAKVDYVLVGKLECGSCGCKMHGESSTGGSKTKRTYYNYLCKRNSGCKSKISKEKIERITATTLEKLLIQVVKNQTLLTNMVKKTNETMASELNSLNGLLKMVNSELSKAITALGNAADEEVICVVNEKIKALKDRKKEIENSIATTTKHLQSSVESVKKALKCRDFDANYIINHPKFFKELLELFVDKIVLSADKVDIVLKDLS